MAELTKKEIYDRMVELRNLRKLHAVARKRVKKLEAENKMLKQRIRILELRDVEKDKIIEELRLQLEELRAIVFGKKNNKDDDDNGGGTSVQPIYSSTPRTKESYRRPVPRNDDITEEKRHDINACMHCNTSFTKVRQKTYYEEDIVLPKKKVIFHKVTQGYCCRRWQGSVTLPCATVILGKNVQTYVCYATTTLRLSFSQIREHLADVYGLYISDGEICKMLERRARHHMPHYEALRERIRGEPAIHMDETSDRVRDGDGYKAHTWLMQAPKQDEVMYAMGQTRGGGVARDLYGSSNAVGITDDYGAYKNLFSKHQLCFAHLHRKLRDLAQSTTLFGDTLHACKLAYALESEIYKKVRSLANRNDLSKRQRILWTNRLSKQLELLACTSAHDPKKLSTYKQTLAKNIDAYLTCIRIPNVPCDNNQAERSLRHVVIKRKISFGHITHKGALTMSILMSVFMTIKNRIKHTDQTFFEAYANFSV